MVCLILLELLVRSPLRGGTLKPRDRVRSHPLHTPAGRLYAIKNESLMVNFKLAKFHCYNIPTDSDSVILDHVVILKLSLGLLIGSSFAS
jgi:hypothetical protein